MKLYSININDVDFIEDDMIWIQSGTREPVKLYISEERMERAGKYRFEADRKRSLCAGYLLNHAIRELDDNIVTPVTVAYQEGGGKPYLPEYPEIYFNLSHSGDYVVCVLDTVPVGIDIECCKSFHDNIAKRFFAPEEYGDLVSIKEDEKREKRFYEYWVLKESFMKAVGLGMQLSMNAFCVHLGERITYSHIVNDRQYEAKLYNPADGYCMAVCRKCGNESTLSKNIAQNFAIK